MTSLKRPIFVSFKVPNLAKIGSHAGPDVAIATQISVWVKKF